MSDLDLVALRADVEERARYFIFAAGIRAADVLALLDRLEAAEAKVAAAWDEGHRFTGFEPERGENPYRVGAEPEAVGE